MTVFRWSFSPLPPTMNNLYKSVPVRGPDGSTRLLRAPTGDAQKWKRAALKLLQGTSVGLVLPTEPLALHIRYFPVNRQRWDTDGRHKLLVDAFAEAFGIDDRGERIPLVTLRRMEPEKGTPRVELAVETFAAWRQRTDDAALWAVA